MARIPLAEIPNANYELPAPAMIPVPNFQVNMAPVASMLRQSVSPLPFITAAEAVGVFEELAYKMADSKNQADLSLAERLSQSGR